MSRGGLLATPHIDDVDPLVLPLSGASPAAPPTGAPGPQPGRFRGGRHRHDSAPAAAAITALFPLPGAEGA
ncbi:MULTISPECIES: hypothetical protein [unclassified Streptomyces]|uniref:hypothetical protein n=1 Tax=unclassified Streptomyces TaxID=2593676 RepID=UPI003818D308